MAKLTFQYEGRTSSIEVDGDDLKLGQIVERLVRPILMAAGFSEETIKEHLGDVDYDSV